MKKIIKTFLIIFMIVLLVMPKALALEAENLEESEQNDIDTAEVDENEDTDIDLNKFMITEDVSGITEGEVKAFEEEQDTYRSVANNVTGLQKIDNVWRMVENGTVNYTYKGLGTNDWGTWYFENGEINFKFTGIYKDDNGDAWLVKDGQVEIVTALRKIDNVWRKVENGKINYIYTGTGTNDWGTWYLEDGEIKLDFTGTYYEGNKAYIVEEGKVYETVASDFTGMVKVNNTTWRVLENGKVNYTYIGISTNDYGTWYLENGEINLKFTGIYKDNNSDCWLIKEGKLENKTGLFKIDNAWRMVSNGKIDYLYSGEGKNDFGTWYLENGEIQLDKTGLFKINNVWRMVSNGKIDTGYTGLGTNDYGTWYLENGEIQLDKTGLFKINNIWTMVTDGKVDTAYTGIGINSYGTWYLENGEINFDFTGTYYENEKAYIIENGKVYEIVSHDMTGMLKVNNKIWRMVINGKINYTYNGIGTNDFGTWYLENGEINFNFTGTHYENEKTYIIEKGGVSAIISKDTTGLLKIHDTWRMVSNGKIDANYTGLGTNDYGTWYLEKGKINFNFIGIYKDKNGDTWVIKEGQVENKTGLIKINNTWRKIVNGKIDYTYTGIDKNDYGTWYLENGEINFKFTGTQYEDSKAYIIEEGKVYAIVEKNTTKMMKINNVWRMVENGTVNYTYTGIQTNDYGIWIFADGKIDTNYNGEYTDNNKNVYNVSHGEVIEIISNSKYPGTMWVDEPIPGNKYLSGTLNVSGWTLAEEKNDIVKVYLDGKFVGNATRKERADVFEVYKDKYGGIANTPLPGFVISVNTKGLGNGSHTIKIVNYASDEKTIIQSRVVEFKITDLTKAWGIDVSQYQSEIRWNEVKARGVEFAIIRIGYYKESENALKIDPYFERNYNECKKHGIAVGGYFYSYAFNSDEASREAAACISAIRGKHFEMPIFIDVEDKILENAVADGRTNRNELTNASITFCNALNNAGYRSGVYANKNFFLNYLNVSALERYNIWLAHYTDKTDYTGKYDLWQYADNGWISGIDTPVDLDWCFTRYY